MTINLVNLTQEKAELLAQDIDYLIQALPELERLARANLISISPPAAKAVERLKKLSQTIRGN